MVGGVSALCAPVAPVSVLCLFLCDIACSYSDARVEIQIGIGFGMMMDGRTDGFLFVFGLFDSRR